MRHWRFKQATAKDFIKKMYGGQVRFWGDDDETQTQTTTRDPVFTAAPEYPEAAGARGLGWQTLQDWEKGGTWGVNLPDYNKVFENAQKRINEYYWGGPMGGGGLMGKIQASAARRGVSDSPAADIMKGRMGAQQAGELGDISTALDVSKAEAIERARGNWMNSIMGLSQMKPSGTWGGTQTTQVTKPQESMWPELIGAGAEIAGSAVLGNYLGAGMRAFKTAESLTGGGGDNWKAEDTLKTMSMFA